MLSIVQIYFQNFFNLKIEFFHAKNVLLLLFTTQYSIYVNQKGILVYC